jgi:hypothetical protein
LLDLSCSWAAIITLRFSTDFAAIGTLDVVLSPFTVSAQLLLEPEELIELVDPKGWKTDGLQFEVDVILWFASLATGVELLAFNGRWFRLEVLIIRFAVVNLLVNGFAVCGLLAFPAALRPLELNEGVVADRVKDALPVLVVVKADAANLACLCTKDNLCVLGELSPVTPVHVVLAIVAPLVLVIGLIDVFFEVVDVFVADNFVETLEDTDLSADVDELCDVVVDVSNPPVELVVEEVIILSITAWLAVDVFPFWLDVLDGLRLLVRAPLLLRPWHDPVLDTLLEVFDIVIDILALFTEALVTAE